MTEQLTFELVSPMRLLASKPVTMVTAPGSEGEFGVLPGHAPVMATLRPGVIEIYEGEQVTDRIFITGGFAEVTAERCVILAQEATPVADLVRAEIEQTIKALQDQLAEASEEAQEILAQRIAVAQAKLECAA